MCVCVSWVVNSVGVCAVCSVMIFIISIWNMVMCVFFFGWQNGVLTILDGCLGFVVCVLCLGSTNPSLVTSGSSDRNNPSNKTSVIAM